MKQAGYAFHTTETPQQQCVGAQIGLDTEMTGFLGKKFGRGKIYSHDKLPEVENKAVSDSCDQGTRESADYREEAQEKL